MLDGIYKMYAYLLIVGSRSVSFAFVVESVVFVDLAKFLRGGICPSGIPVLCIELYRLFVVPRNKEAVHVYGFRSERMEFRLVPES